MNRFPWWVLIGLTAACGSSDTSPGAASGTSSNTGLSGNGSGGGASGNGTGATGSNNTTSGSSTGTSAGDSTTGTTGQTDMGSDASSPSGSSGGTTGSSTTGSGSTGSATGDDGGAMSGATSGSTTGMDSGVVGPPTDRNAVQLATGWKFMASNSLTGAQASAFDDSAWASVSVPHTWDTVLGTTMYSNSWYRTVLPVAASDMGKSFYVEFEGAFQVADVYVNGQHLGQHRGGYTRFAFDATSAMKPGSTNELAVQVSSANCSDCLPDGNTRLFKGYGGIYRKAWLITTNSYHVATTDYASSGVYVTPSNVSAASANVSAKIMLTNDGAADKTFTVKTVISDASGTAVLTTSGDVTVKAGTTSPTTQTGMVSNPHLWAPGNPYLYTVLVTVTVGGTVTDAVTEHIGFRSYSLSTTDFTLNGVSTRIRGVAKHQETEYRATAVSDADLTTDWDNLQDLGVNAVRLVHYPHAKLEYDLADQRGIMVWAENGQTNSGAPTPNGDNITREMIYQNWNHPSIIFWSAGNEASGVAADSEYAGIIKSTDPSRPSVYASNGQSPMNVDFLFHNIYPGWYSGTAYDFLTDTNHWVSESGAGMVVSTHTANPFATTFTVSAFEPEEYGTLVNEVKFDDLFRKPTHLPAYMHWAFREISDGKYKGLFNTKGLLTFSNYKKDVFYLYKSFLKKTPVVHLVGPHYFLRGANAGQGPVKAYSNAAMLTLTVNGTMVSSLANNQYTHPNGTPIANVFLWPNALKPGKNVVSVSDGAGTTDTMTVYFLGTGTMPVDAGAKVTNLTSTVGNAYFIDAPIADQHPFYYDFDSTGDNTFDVVPSVVAGASFITTKRQSDAAKRTSLSFNLPNGADVYIMFSNAGGVPAWVSGGGFADTGATGKWRTNGLALVNYGLYKKTFAAGSSVSLTTTAVDYVVLIK